MSDYITHRPAHEGKQRRKPGTHCRCGVAGGVRFSWVVRGDGNEKCHWGSLE